MARPLARLLVTCLLAVLLVPAFAGSGATAAAQTWTLGPAEEATYVANINAVRAANGLGPLSVDANMTAAARDWTIWMAENTTLQHATDIVTGAPSDWLKVGENVGRGSSLQSVWDAFLASPSHAANVLDPSYNLVGIGVVWTAEGRLYTTHRFASTPAGSPAPDPTPTPPPAAEPEPDPAPVTPPPASTPQPAAPAPAVPAEAEPVEPATGLIPENLPLGDLRLPSGPPATPERLVITMDALLAASA